MYELLPPVFAGNPSNILRGVILDSSVTTYAGKTGLLFSSTNLLIGTICDNEASSTNYGQGASTTETITTLGTYAAPTATKARFKEVDATNHPGLYELQLADSRFNVAGAKFLDVTLSGVTNMAQTRWRVPILTPSNALLTTTIATLTDQKTFTLTAGSTVTGTYAGCGILIQSATTPATKAFGTISTYTGSTKGVVLVADPAIYTMAVGDIVTIYAKTTPSLLGQTINLQGPTVGPSTGTITVGP